MNYADDGPMEALLFSIATFSGRRPPRGGGGGGGGGVVSLYRGEPRAMTLQRRRERPGSRRIWSRFVSSPEGPRT